MTFNTANQQTIYWHDYETWGAKPKKDRPSQFAGIRTDLDLNIIGEPLVVYCQLANDYLPHPTAALVTGIKPQVTQSQGYIEAEFIAKIHQEFSTPNTCVAGYNNIRFDDEVTRYAFFRNFYDPYAREWQDGNSRWDIIDMVRACYALRPEGINWPLREDGKPSFKLEDLTKANNIEHGNAHDALSDVIATIEVAKLIKSHQPKLYDFLFKLRNKREVAALIDVYKMTPVMHVSSMISAEHGCTSWVSPIAYHPDNKNAVICYDLMTDPTPLIDLTSEEIKQKLYTKTEDLAEGEERVGLKNIHINKCPVVAPAKTLIPENAARLNIPREKCLQHLDILKKNPELRDKLAQVFAHSEPMKPETNPDYGLYSGGFTSKGDKAKFDIIHQCAPENLAALDLQFDDPRFVELFFRYKARNYPFSLNEQEQMKWQNYRKEKLMDGKDSPNLTMAEFTIELENMAHEHAEDVEKMGVLEALYKYVQQM
ncbi:MAG: exodeoxyribonuclease-1 [Phenylobacterium sp.]|jgi:exodeoxyribonuclease-1